MEKITSSSVVRTRIAPSPTGIAHVGTAYMAVFNYAFAKQHGGQFIIRTEDTDRVRFVEGAEQVIFDSMRWLGISHDEGSDIGGPYAPYRQSERLDMYRKYVDQLLDQGDAYYCFATPQELDEMRKAQQARGELPRYDGRFRDYDRNEAKKRIANGETYVVRMKMPTQGITSWEDTIRGHVEFENALVEDQVLLKSDGFPTYHLAVVVDDHLMNITHVMRGEEWISSTPKHLNLYKMFGWQPPVYAHMPLLRNPDHSKLSKRKNDVSIMSYKEKGYLPEALINYLCLLGWSHPEKKELFDLQEFVRAFTFDKMQKTGPVFDFAKLNWMNGIYIREKLTTEDLLSRLKAYVPDGYPIDRLPEFLPLIRERLVVLSDIGPLTDFFYITPAVEKGQFVSTKADASTVADQLSKVIEAMQDSSWKHETLEHTIRELQEKNNWHKGQFFMMVRVAITGRTTTPPLFETMQVLGREETLKRLDTALQIMKA